MIQADGENRRYLALAFGYGLAAAVGTKLGEWAVERVRRAVGDEPTAAAGASRASADLPSRTPRR